MSETLVAPVPEHTVPEPLEARARAAAAIARQHADDVDVASRFPVEAVAAMGRMGLLAAGIPVELGGEGASLVELARVGTILGEACSATGMIFAMHQGQVLSLVRHGGDRAAVLATIARVVEDGALVGSATTEIGIGGDTRNSGCSVDEAPDGSVTLQKTAPVISYGLYASAILVTARRTPDSPSSDQVLVIAPAERTELRQTSQWNTLGMRGTCSPGFELTTEVDRDHVLPDDYATISARTVLPVSHVLWAAVWLGMAQAAGEKARKVVRSAALKAIGTTTPGSQRLAELRLQLQTFGDIVEGAARRFDAVAEDTAALEAPAFSMAMNGLKITASELVVEIVTKALLITGIAGYRLDSEASLGRVLRDAHGTAVMINNDRILQHNAQLALLQHRNG